jgi:hypothetical protein
MHNSHPYRSLSEYGPLLNARRTRLGLNLRQLMKEAAAHDEDPS